MGLPEAWSKTVYAQTDKGKHKTQYAENDGRGACRFGYEKTIKSAVLTPGQGRGKNGKRFTRKQRRIQYTPVQ